MNIVYDKNSYNLRASVFYGIVYTLFGMYYI